jgi:RNA polymerase primary sigma factor
MNRVEVTDEQIKAAQAGDNDAMWEIVQAFDPMLLGMIRSVARKASAEDVEDLLQEARAVLIQHIRDYNSDASSAKLTSFVFQAARRRIQEEHVRATTSLTVDPTAVLRIRRALWQADGDVEGAWLIVSTCSNVKSRMERERFVAVVETLTDVERFDDLVQGGEDGDGLTLAEVVADTSLEGADAVERRDLARWLMTQIPQRQALALRAFYGVGMTKQDDPQTCADMGVNGVALRRLRSRGVVSARTVAEVHDIAA